MTVLEHLFDHRTAASEKAASLLREALADGIASDGEAAFVVSGGSTPAAAFGILDRAQLGWAEITLFMSDERCVPTSHEDSNEAMVRRSFVRGIESGMAVVPVYREGLDLNAQCEALANEFSRLRKPLEACLLGMGSDGHFASLFPDFEGLDKSLDPGFNRACLPVSTEASPHPRISLTLSRLLRSRAIILLFFGQEKRAVYEQARQGEGQFPVEALFTQQLVPVHVVWAP